MLQSCPRPYPAVAATAVPPARAGVAAAAANAARQLGLTIGIALCGTISHAAHVRDGTSTYTVVAALLTCGAVALSGGAISTVLLHRERSCVAR